MSASAAGSPGPTGAARWTILGTILLSGFVYSLNAKGTILEADVITQALALDRYKVQWVTGAAGVAGLVSLFSSIYLGRVFGTRRIFVLGAICLTAGSVFAALMGNGRQAIAAAVVRSCAGFYPIQGLVVFQQLLPHRRRFAYCLYLATIYGGQVVVEPLGALLTFNPSWRALFVGMAACGLWLLLVGLFLFPDSRPAQPPAGRFDFAGAALFTAALALIFFLLYRGNYLGWQVSTPVWVACAALVVSLALFVWRELVAPEPFMSLRAFAYRTVTITLLCAACWCGSLYGVAIQLPRCLLVIGYEHWKTGWVISPMALAMMVTMFIGAFSARRRRYIWALRIGLAGMALAGLALARVDLYSSWQWVMLVSAVWGLFAGMCLGPIALLVYEGQQPRDAATTGALKFFMRAFGGTVGVLVAGILIDRGAAWGLEFVRDSVRPGQGALQVAEPDVWDHMGRHGSAPPAAAEQTEALLGHWVNLHAQVIGYRTALLFCAALSAVGLAVSCFIGPREEISIYQGDT